MGGYFDTTHNTMIPIWRPISVNAQTVRVMAAAKTVSPLQRLGAANRGFPVSLFHHWVTVMTNQPIGPTEQEAFDEWCPEPYRQRIWTPQAQEAARAAFAAGWYARGYIGGWTCKACGWRGEMPNTKDVPDDMGTAQVPSCP